MPNPYIDERGNPVATVRLANQVDDDVVAAATGSAGAIAPAIPAVAGKVAYCTGFSVGGLGATAASVIEVTLTGIIGGVTMRWKYSVPAGATVISPHFTVDFDRPIPADRSNLAITLSVPSFGTGNTSSVAYIRGFYRPV